MKHHHLILTGALASCGQAAPAKNPDDQFLGPFLGMTPDHIVNYGATFFQGANCTGLDAAHGPHVNFACNDLCWDINGARSVLLEGKYFYQPTTDVRINGDPGPWYPPDGLRTFFEDVMTEGPSVRGFATGCVEAELVGEAAIPNGHNVACLTFDKPVYSAYIRLLKECRKSFNNQFDPLMTPSPPEVENFEDEFEDDFERWVREHIRWEDYEEDGRKEVDEVVGQVEEEFDEKNGNPPQDSVDNVVFSDAESAREH